MNFYTHFKQGNQDFDIKDFTETDSEKSFVIPDVSIVSAPTGPGYLMPGEREVRLSDFSQSVVQGGMETKVRFSDVL